MHAGFCSAWVGSLATCGWSWMHNASRPGVIEYSPVWPSKTSINQINKQINELKLLPATPPHPFLVIGHRKEVWLVDNDVDVDQLKFFPRDMLMNILQQSINQWIHCKHGLNAAERIWVFSYSRKKQHFRQRVHSIERAKKNRLKKWNYNPFSIHTNEKMKTANVCRHGNWCRSTNWVIVLPPEQGTLLWSYSLKNWKIQPTRLVKKKTSKMRSAEQWQFIWAYWSIRYAQLCYLKH